VVSETLKDEIKKKMDVIRLNPDSYDKRAELIRDSIHNIGDLYSFWIENPELRDALLLGNRTSESVMEIAHEGIRNIKNAWHYLMDFGLNSDFVNRLDPRILCGTNALVNGRKTREGDFRMDDATLNYSNYQPPHSWKIPADVRDALRHIRESYFEDPLETSIYAHLALSLIQPFAAGNKRTARLIQNRMLCDVGLPPVLIPAGEGKLYMRLLGEAVPAYLSGGVKSDTHFFDYIASKVNNGLDMILGDLTRNVDVQRGI
jgi:hypothetical protein